MNIHIEWHGTGINEVGTDKSTGREVAKINPKYFRIAEDDLLWGNSEKTQKELGWVAKTSLDEIVSKMVQYDLENNNYGEYE